MAIQGTSENQEWRGSSGGPTDPLLGSIIADRFKIRAIPGTGAWGRVYLATDLEKEADVALKVLHLHLVADEQILLRFEREARSGFSLVHPNICEVLGQGTLPTGQPYMVMEYLEGENLAARLRRGTLSVEESIGLFLSCAQGLQCAESKGIVHRDIKPANIFLVAGEVDKAKLLDFGMAKIVAEHNDLTQTGPGFGTIHYMSPEQVLGEPVDTRSDIYAFGCVMYEALTGRKVFDGRSAYQVMEQHVREIPAQLRSEQLHIPLKLESVVLKALNKAPADRFQSTEELIEALIDPD
ncbi:MAG: serine/threonine protein kinase [Candidatus Obscuribacterales bacterium]|nr:serine/threonine protein kinase [Candidatus Obscuribacterales bacterium]